MKKLAAVALSTLAAATLLAGALHAAPVSAQTPGLVPVQNPTGGNVGPQYNPNPSNVGPQYNPSAGNVPQSYNPQVSNQSMNLAVEASTSEAAPGDVVLFAGMGFAANGRGGDIFVNLVYPSGLRLDTRSAPVSCSTDAAGNLIYGPDGNPVCSSGAAGQRIASDANGDFIGAVEIPAAAPAGQAQLCASSIFSNPVCTPIWID